MMVVGTPTIMLNGWRLNGAHSPLLIGEYVGDILKGEGPFASPS